VSALLRPAGGSETLRSANIGEREMMMCVMVVIDWLRRTAVGSESLRSANIGEND
jgi:hypothetical protein